MACGERLESKNGEPGKDYTALPAVSSFSITFFLKLLFSITSFCCTHVCMQCVVEPVHVSVCIGISGASNSN